MLASLAEIAARLRVCADWSDECEPLVATLGRVAGVDRSVLWRNDRAEGGELCATVLTEWTAPGVPVGRGTLWGDDFPWEPGGFGRWAASVCEAPIQVAGRWWGRLGLGSADDGRRFRACEIDALRVAAACLGAAIERQHELERPVPAVPAAVTPPTAPLATILLVEDEPLVLRLVERLLEGGGYAVVPVATPGEARQLAAAMPAPDLLVTDVVLPGRSGPELAAELRLSWPGLRVLYVSGYPGEAFGERGLERGEGLLHKPFRGTELLAAVRSSLS
ncbi:MAG: response regulator [Thermoleophilia bacterium]|nr:response regulator [Thermoleophilia bacterium]